MPHDPDRNQKLLRRCVWSEVGISIIQITFAGLMASRGKYELCAIFVLMAIVAAVAAWDLNRRFGKKP